MKNFPLWLQIKEQIELETTGYVLYPKERQIWWCHLGCNIGVEVDGKNDNFTRPALVIKKFGGDLLWVVPLTTTPRSGMFYYPISFNNIICFVMLSHLREISSKRLTRKITRLSPEEFAVITEKVSSLIGRNPTLQSGESRDP